jgi:CheY-like chemotaxis protein
VDDQRTILRATCRLLESAGYATLTAPSGAEALRLAGEQKPDLVLLDAGLPDISGLTVCKQIKADPRLRRDGQSFPAEITSTIFQEGGEARTSMIIRDKTERRQL